MEKSLDFEILTQTFDNLPIGVGIFHVEDLNDLKSIRYVFMNKVLLYEMRKEKEDVNGKTILEVAPEAYEHEGGLLVIDTYRKIAAEGGSINLGLVEYSNHLVAGTYECSVHHIKDNYVYVMLRNVTELENTKNELEEKNKELNQMTYIVSHDLQEPLRTISSFIDIIRDENQGGLGEDTEELLGFISSSSDRMSNLILDLLDYSTIGKKKEMAGVDCENLVEHIQQDMKALIKNTDTTIQVGELPKINGFKTELRLLFQNLISNGIKFCKPGVAPKIDISAQEQDGGWTFQIKDNGIGIAAEYQEKIFGVFERLHGRDEYEGTGIGLAHCKKIIELHVGKLWVDSNHGEGSTFSFTIPNSF